MFLLGPGGGGGGGGHLPFCPGSGLCNVYNDNLCFLFSGIFSSYLFIIKLVKSNVGI